MVADATMDDAEHSAIVEVVLSAKLAEINSFNDVTTWCANAVRPLLRGAHRFANVFWQTLSLVRVILFGPAVGFLQAPFLGAVLHVVGLRAKKQVFWVDAQWRIAAMEHEQGAIKGAIGDLIRRAVRACLAAIEYDRAVARVVRLALPQPARFGFDRSVPEIRSHRTIYSYTGSAASAAS